MGRFRANRGLLTILLNQGASDTVAPTVAITMSDYTITTGDTPTVTFAFSEAPTGFTVADVTAPNGALSAFGVTGDPLVYTAMFTPTDGVDDATNVITVDTDWTDAAGNPPAGATTSDNYTVDTTLLVEDTFTAADTTSLNNRAPSPINTPGNNWSAAVGTWTIVSNKATCSTPSSGNFNNLVLDSEDANVKLSMDVTVPAGDSYGCGFIVRYTDSTHFLYLLYVRTGGTSQLQVRKANGGAASTVLTVESSIPTVGSTITFIASLDGNTMELRQGLNFLTYTDTFNNTATIHGITEYRDGTYTGSSYDNFSVDSSPTLAALGSPHTALYAMPAELNQHSFEELDGVIYVVGGESNGSGAANKLYAYTVATNAWATKADLPVSVQSSIFRAVGTKLYLIGGMNASSVKLAGVYEYDPTGNSWAEKLAMPTAREDMGAGVVGDKIYVFGGLVEPGTTPTALLEIYDTTNNTWDETKADMPAAKCLGDFGATYDGKVYAVGATNTMTGYPNLTPINTVYEYDPVGDTWTAKSAMPVPRCYAECAVVGNILYVVSGCTSNTTTYTNTIYGLNLDTNTWSLIGTAPYSARGIGLAVSGGFVYMCGGWINTTLGAVPHLFKLSL